MKPYPKIETLYTRDKKTFKVTNEIRLPEFEAIKNWRITEKIDGTNIRIGYKKGQDYLSYMGRTDKAQIPTFLIEKLQSIFSVDLFKELLGEADEFCLYGEGYGEKIQKGGGNYRKGVSFRLFDVWVDNWWLKWEDVEEIANDFKIKTVPVFATTTLKNAVDALPAIKSLIALEENKPMIMEVEGIVATSEPLILFRNGKPIKWKLKNRDYIGGKR